MHVLMAVDEIRRAPEAAMNAANWRAISATRSLGLSRRSMRAVQRRRERQEAPSCERHEGWRQRPERRRQRHMQPDRGAFRALRSRSACGLVAVKLGATTITEVALMRPRATRSRIAGVDRGRDAVIVGAQDDAAARVHSAAVRAAGLGSGVSSRASSPLLGDEIDRPAFDLVEDLADIFADARRS